MCLVLQTLRERECVEKKVDEIVKVSQEENLAKNKHDLSSNISHLKLQ